MFTNLIEQIYNESGHIYGAGKITAILKSKGYKVSEETVSKIVHENGWFSMRSCSKKLYNRDQHRKRKENLSNRFFIANRLNEIWVSDVTCFPVNDKNQYICVIIDIFSRKVIAYKISRKIQLNLREQHLISHTQKETQHSP
ncbi:MAG: IS3 family transposase [Clostridia bacterium]|nr:IS3 family transposase [Clostridia bacterium]